MRKKEKAVRILEELQKDWPVPETELQYQDPWQLLVAVILSAQCTDKRVNIVTPDLFERFPEPVKMAEVDAEEIYPYIKSISYPNNKSKHLAKSAKIIRDKHDGKVPKEYNDILKLPGVGRKTANVVTSVLYDEPRMPVDTHVFRVSKRLGIASGKTPLAVEKELTKLIPDEMIGESHHLLILHGRYVCKARTPDCENCRVSSYCNYFKKEQKKNQKKNP